MAASYAVGIDLGTTHCALSSARLDHPAVRLMEIPQLVAPGELAARALLPSFLYLAAPGELSAADRSLPWGEQAFVVGEAARRLGAKVPNRLVASAKSWVCHGGVDRRAPILPWNAPEHEPHVSPFTAQVEYLAHMRAAWDLAHPDAPLVEQDVVVTVPASFDEGARELTTAAAREAGLGEVRLLEEPQAAFYDWLGSHTVDLGAQLGDARLILVVDVGGGTTDLTLLRVRPDDGGIDRIAVGGHLMLGGDNMDAALAVFALDKAGIARPEDATVWSALVQSARQAKERLLAADAPAQAVITLQGRGSKLVGNTRSIVIEREEAARVLLDGFLPATGPTEIAQRVGRAGLTTLGLPYTSDTAIVRHVCTFLRLHAAAASEAGATVVDGLPRPDRVLLNGGVFNAPALVDRLMEVLAGWYGGAAPIVRLDHTSLDLAVAHGAVRSALARRGIGEVIGGGSPRAYYIGVDAAGGERRALCVAPKGMEPGASAAVADRVFELVLDQPVAFPLFAYTGDRVDAAGALVELAGDDALESLPPLETLLREPAKSRDAVASAGRTVPVTLSATLGETGALEIYLVTVDLPPRRWRLDFVVRRAAAPASAPVVPVDAPKPDPSLPAARTIVVGTFGRGATEAQAKQLRAAVEKPLGTRGQWSAATCRALGDVCLELAPQREMSEQHELAWMRLLGWCLRPGFGVPGDEARMDAMWRLREEGLVHRSKANWAQWWILWRWIAAGLDAARQRELFEELRPWLWRASDAKPPAGPHKHGPIEMMQLLAVLERLGAGDKREIGELLLERAEKIGSYWPLGRVGARVSFAGERDDVVAPEVVVGWIERLLAMELGAVEGGAFALASMARMTGDARRDVDAGVRKRVAERLRQVKAQTGWIEMVLRAAELSEGDRGRMFGESLPGGLRLG
ncbi:MAG: Hsp70 family protein [Deltaproteobacteria bacterium]|nr:Hsp70 family protein [Nannocystaceae bacterium]